MATGRGRRLLDFGRGAELPDGGFGWLGDDGAVDPGQPCPLYINARMTHVFALAHLQDVAGAGSLAASGIAAFSSRYADRANGGWFTETDRSGHVIDSAKANYAHAHVLLAGASATAAGIPGADAVLAAAAAAIERHFWSDAEGCAVESWNADFTVSEPYRGANSNMHSVEAYLAAGDVTGDAVWRERAASIAARLIDRHARANSWRVPEHYDAEWRPLLDYNIDRPGDQFRPYGTTPGHSFEWARLLLDLEAAIEAAQAAPPAWLAESATALFDTAVADAENRDGYPGLIYTVDENGQPVVTARLHWVACEAVLAADALQPAHRPAPLRGGGVALVGRDQPLLHRSQARRLAPGARAGHDPGRVDLVGQARCLPLVPGAALPLASAEPGRRRRARRPLSTVAARPLTARTGRSAPGGGSNKAHRRCRPH